VRLDLHVAGSQSRIELSELLTCLLHDGAHGLRRGWLIDDARHGRDQHRRTAAWDKPELGEQTAHAVQQRGAFVDPAPAHAVPGEDGLLLDGLDRDKARGGLARGDGDGQRIVAVVLATLAQGHDELGGHEPRGVAAGGEDATPVMRRAAGFHGHDAGAGQGQESLGPALEGSPPQDLALDHGAARIEHADGEDILGQIDADGSHLFHDFPSCLRIDDDESQSWHLRTTQRAVRLHGRFRTGKSFAFGQPDELRRGCAGHHFILARLRHSGARRLTQTFGLTN